MSQVAGRVVVGFNVGFLDKTNGHSKVGVEIRKISLEREFEVILEKPTEDL